MVPPHRAKRKQTIASSGEDQGGPVRPSGLVARGGGQGTVVGLCAKCYKLAQLDPARAMLLHPQRHLRRRPEEVFRRLHRVLPPARSRSATRAAARELVLPLDATHRALSFL